MQKHHGSKPSCCLGSRSSISKDIPKSHRIQIIEKQDVRFKEKMVYPSGGEFLMGAEEKDGFSTDNEGPVRKVNVKPFYIDRTTVSNSEFKQFIEETNYITDAERYGWSFVFHKFLS